MEQSSSKATTVMINVEKDEIDRNEIEKQPFDLTPSDEDKTEREKSILTMHRSNQNTSLCNSQVSHDDTPRLVSQHISNNMRSPLETPERRKREREHADSSWSEQNIAKKLDFQQATH